jgi:RNA ligase (TIGR02306 family)
MNDTVAEITDARKLATIRKIVSVDDIVFTNADGNPEIAQNIVRVKVDGWSCVTQRSNNFMPGDLCVYFEIDSVLPHTNPAFDFLGDKKRLRTIKLKGQVSQGLVLPLSEIGIMGQDGDDLTEVLGVTKYEPPISPQLAGQVKGSFPGFLVKTDEDRIQNVGAFFHRYPDVALEATEKLDGTSFTAYYNNGEFGVCSRNLDLKESEGNAHWIMARKLGLKDKLVSLGFNICIQGELIGPGIQKNRYQLREAQLWVFSIFDINTHTYMDNQRVKILCDSLGLQMVPVVVPSIKLSDHNVESLLEMADGRSVLADTAREGLVFRPIATTIYDDHLGRLSFKVISNKFLLKNDG